MWALFRLILVGYIFLTALIYLFQRRLMYLPARTIAGPDVYGLLQTRETFVQSADGPRIQLWHEPAKPDYPTVVYFHGNAGHIGERAAKFSSFSGQGFGFVAISYRGFGKSEGSPSETGIYNDARAAIDYALNILKISQNRLIYFGESLGSGVAVQMATERPPALLMLEAAYTSVETRAAENYRFLIGARYLVLDKYDSLTKIKNIRAPLLMLHGVLDDVIPLHHGQTLFQAASEPKEMVIYPDVHHADYTNEQIIEPLVKQARKLRLI